MKAKKNLAYRLAATIPKEEFGKFLDFVNWYKSEILDFATLILDKKIANDVALKKHKTYTVGTLRGYKSRLKDCVLEYCMLTTKDKRLIDTKDLLRIQTLNGLGEDFLKDALSITKRELYRTKNPLKLGLKICFSAEVTRSMRELNKESIADIIDATELGILASQDVQQAFEILNFYYQSFYFSRQLVLLRSEESILKFEKLSNHSARYIKNVDIKHVSEMHYWLSANASLEYFSDDLTFYVQFMQKKTQIGLDGIELFGENQAVNKFIFHLELAGAYLHIKNTFQAKKELDKSYSLIPLIKADASIQFYYGEYYNNMMILATADSNITAPIKELWDLIENNKVISANAIQLYKISILHYYIFNQEYEKAFSLAEEIIGDRNKVKLSNNELEVTRFLILVVQLSKIMELKKLRKSEANHFVYFQSLLNAYQERIRRKKNEFQIELIFVKHFLNFNLSSSLKEIKTGLKELRTELKKHEEDKSIFYQIQFKRVFDYERWLEQVLG